jgi:hypothetical protein
LAQPSTESDVSVCSSETVDVLVLASLLFLIREIL